MTVSTVSKSMSYVRRALLAVCVICVVSGCARAAAETNAEPVVLFDLPPITEAKDVVPTAMLENKNYTLVPDVTIQDFYYRFHLDTPNYGSFDVLSMDELYVRTFEIDVLTAAPSIDGKKEFGRAAKSTITETAKAAAKTVVTPVQSAKAIGAEIEDGSRAFYDFIRLRKRNQPKDSFLTGEEKRKQAVKLGLDVYSTNPAVQDYLDTLAKSRSAGSTLVDVSVSVTTFVIPFSTPLSVAINAGKYREHLKEKLESLAPMELYRFNDKALKKMDVPSAEREQFLEFARLTPKQKTEILADLKTLDGMNDKIPFLHACRDEHPTDGVWQVQCADMLAKYNKTVVPIQSALPSGLALSATASDGRQLIFFPADTIYWCEAFAKSVDATVAASGGLQKAPSEFVTNGHVSHHAKDELEKRGFTIRESFLNEEKQP